MNSFLKGFCSLFDWMFPKTVKEQLDDLDNSIQQLYDRMGWGPYSHPFEQEEAKRQRKLWDFPSESQKSWMYSGWNTAADINRAIESQQPENKTNWDVYFDNLQKQYTKFDYGNLSIDREKVLQKMSELPKPNCSYISNNDINRVLEAQQSLMDEIYRGNSASYQSTERYYKPKQIRDPARPRKNKYL